MQTSHKSHKDSTSSSRPSNPSAPGVGRPSKASVTGMGGSKSLDEVQNVSTEKGVLMKRYRSYVGDGLSESSGGETEFTVQDAASFKSSGHEAILVAGSDLITQNIDIVWEESAGTVGTRPVTPPDPTNNLQTV